MASLASLEPELVEHDTWAVLDADGDLLEVVHGGLRRAASRYPQAVLDLYGVREDDLLQIDRPGLAANPRDADAMEASRLPFVGWDLLTSRYPLGPEGLAAAHRALVSYFPTEMSPGRRIAAWSTPSRMAESLLGKNHKLKKHVLDPASRTHEIFGLSLLPNVLAFKRLRTIGTLCQSSTPECRALCLVYTGRSAQPYNERVKMSKTQALLAQPLAFCRMLLASVERYVCVSGCGPNVAVPSFRLNLFSDIPWELFFPGLFEAFGDVQFYDYTKVPERDPPANYDLTFSYSGRGRSGNLEEAWDEVTLRRRRLAVVFLLRKGDPMPDRFRLLSPDARRYLDLDVIDGTVDDLRPLDPAPICVGLRYLPPVGRRRDIARLREFVIPCDVVDGNVVATEAPRFTEAGLFEENE